MKKLAVVLAVVVSVFVNGQDQVYVIGEDSTSLVLQSGVGEKVLNQYKLKPGVGGETDTMITRIKSYFNDSSLILHFMTTEIKNQNSYTKKAKQTEASRYTSKATK